MLVAVAITIAFGFVIPLHLADEHHGHAEESREGEDHEHESPHDAADHTTVAVAPAASSHVVDLRLAVVVADGPIDPVEPGVLLAVGRGARSHDPPEPDQAAIPPSPPRGPPTLHA